MPTYEFKCNECKHQFEVFTSISEKGKTTCPKCKSRKITQLLSSFYMMGRRGFSALGESLPDGRQALLGRNALPMEGSSGSSCGSCSSTSCSSCSSKK